MYKVKKFFTDLQDEHYAYKAGDIFPRKGHNVTEDRIKELSTSDNKRGIPLIEEVADENEADVEAENTADTEATAAEKNENEEVEVKTDDVKADKPKTDAKKGTGRGRKKNA